MKKNPKIVIALGGNALGNTPMEQYEKVEHTSKIIVDLIESGYDVIVSHGNGPQVGMISLAFDNYDKQQKTKINLPLSLAAAMSQGYIGIHLKNAINNEFLKRNLPRKAYAIISQTLIDQNDKSFENPSKPIGLFYTKEESIQIQKENPSWLLKEDSGRGYRRFVPSPKPIDILEKDLIKELSLRDKTLIVSGGGGVSTILNHKYELIDSIIDKDFASELLAELVDADIFIIATAVEYVYLNFGKVEEIQLKKMNYEQLNNLAETNAFPEGSMKPKVEAVLKFVEFNKSSLAIICSLDKIKSALKGESGTHITFN